MREQRGVFLVDMLLSTTIFVVVFTALMISLQTSAREDIRGRERAAAIGDAHVGLRRMTSELRQARQVFAAGTTSSSMDVLISKNGQPTRVIYRCNVQPTGSAYLQCVRASTTNVAEQPSAVGGEVVLERVLNGTTRAPSTNLFTYSPNATAPTFVRVTLVVPRGGRVEQGYRGSVVLDDGVYLRNLGTQ